MNKAKEKLEETLVMVAFGYSNRQISKILGVPLSTSKYYIRRLCKQYGATDKLELAMMRWWQQL